MWRTWLIVIASCNGGAVDALTLRSSNAVDYTVDTALAVIHSTMLQQMVDDLGVACTQEPVFLPNIASTELHLIVDFMYSACLGEVWHRLRTSLHPLSTGLRYDC